MTNRVSVPEFIRLADRPKNISSAAYVNSLQVKAGKGTLLGLTGFNSKGSAQWIQIFDAQIVPSEAAIPLVIIYVAATSSFSLDFGIYGRDFDIGILICNSSTGPTKTIGSADVWLDVQYL